MSGWWGWPEPKPLEKESETSTELKPAEKESNMQYPEIKELVKAFAEKGKPMIPVKPENPENPEKPEIQADLESLKYIMDNRQKLAESVKQKLGETLEECREYMRIIEFLDPEYAKNVSEKFRDWYLNRN